MNVRSFVTIILTLVLVACMFLPINPPKEILALYCTTYGSIMTFFFTKPDKTRIINNECNKE